MMTTSRNPAPHEVNRYGLSQVYAPVGDAEVDVVFVHGLNGDPRWTWTSDKSKIFWPAQLLPDRVEEEKARILVYGYDASLTSFTDAVTPESWTHSHAEHLVKALAANRGIYKATERPIIFVAHSFGGLIVKRALIYSSEAFGSRVELLRSVFVSTYGILFLGTPHHGPARLKWIWSVVMSKQVFDSQIQLVKTLKESDETLQNISQQFTDFISRFRIYCFHEGRPSNLHGIVKFVVDESSAPMIPDIEYATIQQDHSHMCKFESDSAPGFEMVAEGLQRFASEAPNMILNRWASEKAVAKKQNAMTELIPDMLDRRSSYKTLQGTIGLPNIHDSGTSFDTTSPRQDPELLDEGHDSEYVSNRTFGAWGSVLPSRMASPNRNEAWGESGYASIAPLSTPYKSPMQATDQRTRAEIQKRVREDDQRIRAYEVAAGKIKRAPDMNVHFSEQAKLVLAQDSGTLFLVYGGFPLTWRASMLCLTLASCACDRVPAFLFTRPNNSKKRRWNSIGEIGQTKISETKAMPQWLPNLFWRTEVVGLPKKGQALFEDSALGFPHRGNGPQFFNLAPDIAELSSMEIVSFDLDEDCVLLAMRTDLKEALWRQTSIDDRLFIWFGLLKLVIFSFPDVYAEIMWQQVQWRCRDVVRSTIIPFLSVVGWSELSSKRSLISPLLSFLTHYSICDSSGLDLNVLFEGETIENLKDSYEFRLFDSVATYTKDLRTLLLKSQTAQHNEVQKLTLMPTYPTLWVSSNNLERGPRTSGLLGLVLDSQLRLARPSFNLEIAELVIEDWKTSTGTENSTLVRCARSLLSAGRDKSEEDTDAPTSAVPDLEITATLGQAMMSRGSYSKAYTMLAQRFEVLQTVKADSPQIAVPGIFHITVLEFIKCCNVGNVEDFDPMWAEPYFLSASLLHRSYLNVGLADWYIGRRDYVAAKTYLKTVLDDAERFKYLTIIVNLRLNKVDRRLRCLDQSTLKTGGYLFMALSLVDHINTDLSNECLDELHATMAFARWNGLDVAADAKAVLAANVTVPEENWRLSALDSQCEGMRACILGL